MWQWIRKNWWVPLAIIGFTVLFLLSAGRTENPFVKLNRLRRRLDKDHQEKVEQVKTDTKARLEAIKREHLDNLNKLEEEVENEKNRLSDPHNTDELVAILRKRYSQHDNDL